MNKVTKNSLSLLVFSFLLLAAVVFAATFTDDTQSEFDAGTYSNTVWSTDHVELSSGQTSGDYTSRVLDASSTATWNTINWSETIPSTENLFVVDGQADVWKSSDGGTNWALVKDDYTGADSNSATYMVSDSSENLYILYNQDIWQSTNSGTSWTKVNDDYNGGEGQNGVAMTIDSNDYLYVADGDEDIWRSTDSGSNWSKRATNINSGNGNIYGMAAVGTALYAVDGQADVWGSTDGGAVWTLVKDDYNDGKSNAANDMTSDSGGNLYIMHNQDIWRSANAGVDWTLVTDDYNGGETNTGQVIIVDSNNYLYIGEGDEDIWRSVDSGSNWTKLATNMNGGNGNILGMAITNVSADLRFQARSGSANPPTGDFVGPNGTTGTYHATAGGENLNVSDNQYFQYKAYFTTNDVDSTPELSSVTIDYSLAGDTTSPAAVSDLAASSSTQSSVTLTWTAPGDDDNTGTATSYDMRYSTSSITEGNWSSANQATGEPTPSAANSSESMTVSSLAADTPYYFALKTSDEVPNESTLSNVVSTSTAAADTVSATAAVDTDWVKGGATNQNFVFTVTNSANSSEAIQWVRITQPSSNYTMTSGISSGWSATAGSGNITFTGGSITVGAASTFTITTNIASVDQSQLAWTINVDDSSGGESPTDATAESGGALDTGIDSTAPTNIDIALITVNSSSRLTANATTSADSASGLHASPYWFDETTGEAGATDSTAWQTPTAFADDGLSASIEYCYRVKARDIVGNESAFSTQACATTAATSDSTDPAAVTNLTASGASNNSVTLTWTAPGDDDNTGTATSYDIRYSTEVINDSSWGSATEATGEPAPSAAGSSESFTATGLTSQITYYFALKTSDEAPNVSELSNVASKTTTEAADSNPPSISSVFVSTVSSHSVTVIWNTDEASDSQVEYGTSLSYGSETTLQTSLVTNHVVEIASLSPQTTYHFRVKSRDASNNLATTVDYVFTTSLVTFAGDFDPPEMSNISAVTTWATATIGWVTNEPATSHVEYGFTTEYGNETRKDWGLVTNHEVQISNLKHQTKYNFRVISEDVVENEAKSGNFTFATERPPPEALPAPELSEVAVVAVRPTSAKIAWKTDILATSKVSFGTKPGNLTQVTLEFATLVTEHSVTLSDLEPNTIYYFAAISRNTAGKEGYSDENNLQTEPLEIQTIVDISKPNPLTAGSPGTQTPKTSAGETVTLVPILPTEGDKEPPTVTLFRFAESPTENTSPTIHGRAVESSGVIAGISYSTDNGESWHPITDVTGIGSSAASFSAKIPNLADGNYPILFRIRDNSGNIGKSETKVLVVDVQPPATGANVMLLGNQAILPNAFGTFSTLSGITQRIVTSAVGGAILVEVIALKPGEEGVEETSVSTVSSQVELLNVREGAGTNFSTIEQIRSGKKYKLLLSKNGLAPSEVEGWYHIDLGNNKTGWVFGELTALETKIIQKSKSGLSFPLTYSKSADLWFGDIRFENPGEYQLQIRAEDGASQVSLRSINPIIVAEAGKVIEAKTGKALAGTTVSVFQFSLETDDFLLWPGEVFNQANPQMTGADGTYRFILPPGKYYLKIEGDRYKNFYTDLMELKSHMVINFVVPMTPRPKITITFPIIGKKEIALPYLPDFWGAKSITKTAKLISAVPESIKEMLGKPAPVFSLPKTDGEELDIRYLRGTKTIISTWATWSPLAQIQIPILDELEREEEDVRVLLLALQESPGVVQTYLKRGNYTLESVIDREGKITRLYPILTLPQHFFLDRRGVLQDVHVGFLNKEDLKEKLEGL